MAGINPNSLNLGLQFLPYPILTPIPDVTFVPEDISLTPEISTEHPVPPKDEYKVTQQTSEMWKMLILFIMGALIFLVLFAWFNIIKILVDIFYESIYPSSVQPGSIAPTQRDFHIALVKQVTFTFIITVILMLFVKYNYKIYGGNGHKLSKI